MYGLGKYFMYFGLKHIFFWKRFISVEKKIIKKIIFFTLVKGERYEKNYIRYESFSS